MKQFQFRLDTVLNYKQQILETRLIEHGAAVNLVKRQEEVLAQTRRRLTDCEKEYGRQKAGGLSVAEAMKYQNGVQVLERSVLREAEILAKLRRAEEEKRLRVVEAKKETSSLEKLREKREEEYIDAVRKAEEKLIDDLTIARRTVGGF